MPIVIPADRWDFDPAKLGPQSIGVNMEKELEVKAQHRQQEIESILANDTLLEFMQSGLPNSGTDESDEVLLQRGIEYAKAFSEIPSTEWAFNEQQRV